MAQDHLDPKSAGLGADLLSTVDLVTKSHGAVRDVLLALESVTLPDAAGGALDEFRNKAQVARRVLETLESELDSLRGSLTSGSPAPGVATGGAASHVHVHLHLELSQSNGQLRLSE